MQSHPPEFWEQLIREARAGSGEALGRLLSVFRPYLLAMANEELDPLLRPKAGGSDLVQETFLNAHQHIGQFRGGTPDELLAWLRQILRNQTANFRRHYLEVGKRQATREVPLGAADRAGLADGPAGRARPAAQEAAQRERFRRLERALDRLPAEQRSVVEWRNLELLPMREIAARLGVTEKVAHKRWSAAIAALQALLDEQAA